MFKLRLFIPLCFSFFVASCSNTYRFTHVYPYDSEGVKIDTLETKLQISINERRNSVTLTYDDVSEVREIEQLDYSYPPFTFVKKKKLREGLRAQLENKGFLSIGFRGYGFIKLKDSTDRLGYGFSFKD